MENDKKLYMYVYRMILNDIYNGRYTFESKLPPLVTLCEQYGVGRNTMRSALLELSKDGYISLKKGVQATMIFNIKNPEDLAKYKQELVNRKSMLRDAYETMELILPNIVVHCLAEASSEEIDKLNLKVDQLPIKNIQNGSELIEELYGIYLEAFSILKNPLLNDVFMTMMHSVNPAITDDYQEHHKLQQSLKMLKTIMKAVLKFSKKNDFIIRKGISKMCSSSSERGFAYIDDMCQGMEVTQEKEFIWIGNRSMDYLYIKVIANILRKIYFKEYHRGTKLPSIQKLSQEYDVSEKTTRKALDILREFKVVETVNGVGSTIVIDNIQKNKHVMEHKEMKAYIEQYFYSVQLLSLILESISSKILKDATQEDFLKIKIAIEESDVFSLEPLNDYIFSKTNKCLRVIYEELMKIMIWSLFINQFIDLSVYQFAAMKTDITDALESQDVTKICQISQKIFQASLEVKEKIYA